MPPSNLLPRRAFLRNGTLHLLTTAAMASGARAEKNRAALRLGLVTDLHFADKPAHGTRFYRQTPAKLEEAGAAFEKAAPQHVVELGDFIDAADSVAAETGYLRDIHRRFSALPGRKHFVLGNHCVFTLTKREFLDGVQRKRSFYSFDEAGFHFVLLDACHRSDGADYGRKNFQWTDAHIPPSQLEWLAADLRQAKRPAIVFVHQRLDVANHYGVRNAPSVRRILEESGRVQAVFQGHSHKNDHRVINGIHYTTLVAMVEGAGEENNGYSILKIQPNGALEVTGFRKQNDYRWG